MRKTTKNLKRLLCMLIALIMAISTMPFTVFAGEYTASETEMVFTEAEITDRLTIQDDPENSDIKIITVTLPCTVVASFTCYHSDQESGGLIPMPYAVNYQALLNDVIADEYYCDSGKPDFAADGGDFEYISYVVTEEDIENAGGEFTLYYNVRAVMYPDYTASALGQKYNISIKAYDTFNLFEDPTVHVHTYDADGFCSDCGAYEQPSMGDFKRYEIKNAGNLFWYAEEYMNNSKNDAILTQDIDLKNREWTPIGNGSRKYSSWFYGNGYTISNMKISDTPEDYQGLFGYAYGGKILNLTVKGTINCNAAVAHVGGIVGYADLVEIQGVKSYVNITDTGVVLHHVGGIVGSATLNTYVQYCANYGDITLTEATDCVGGIAAYANDRVQIANCVNYGNIHSDASGALIGGILGYINSTLFESLKNCYNIGEVSCPSNNYCGAVVGWARDGSSYTKMTNNYYLEGSSDTGFGVDGRSGTAVSKTAAEFQSGEVAYLLGDAFGQKLGTDDYPLLYGRNKVYRYKVTECNGDVSQCTYSNDSTLEVDEVKEHIYGDWSADSDACTRTCTVCGYVVDTKAHEFGEWTIDNDKHSAVCSVCGYEEQNEHTYSDCTDEGEIHSFTCTECGYKLTAEHNFGDWTADGDACTRTCIDCAHLETKAHNFDKWTINADNHIGTCSDCGYEMQDTHTYDSDGFCEVCGGYEIPSQDSDGVYQIANAGNLFWFAALVNGDSSKAYFAAADTSAKAVLTQDIDLKSKEWAPIGANGVGYAGTFNGQGHTISNMKISNISADNQGLFGYVSGAAISDFTVTGAINCNTSVSHIGGVVGQASNSKITSVASYVDITDTGIVLYHVGGIVGSATGSTAIDKCVNYGNVTLTKTVDCVGGIAAYANDRVQITNSVNYGNIHSNASGTYMGGILGYVNSTNFAGITNCVNIGEVGCSSNNRCGAIAGWVRDSSSYTRMTNNYYLEGCSDNAFGPDGNSGTAESKTKADFQSGEVAYLLGDAFGQEIDKDSYPLLNGEPVYRYDTTDCQGNSSYFYSNDSTLENVDKVHIYGEWTDDGLLHKRTCTACQYTEFKTHIYADSVCTLCGAKETAPEQIDGIYQIGTVEELYWFAAYVNAGNQYAAAVLTADITVNENVLNSDGTLNGDGSNFIPWIPIGNTENECFKSTFDGQGHVISGLYIADNNDYRGLFGYVYRGISDDVAAISNVGVVDSYFEGNKCVGAVCGVTLLSSIKNCYSSATVVGNSGLGGICGSISMSGANNCYAVGRIDCKTSDDNVGAISGSSCRLNSCYALEGIAKKIAPDSYFTSLTNCEFKTAEQFASGEVAYLLGDAFGQKLGTDEYPVLNGDKVYYCKTTECNGTDVSYSYSNDSSLQDVVKEHTFGKWIADRGDTCTRTCSVCGYVETQAHNFGDYTFDSGSHTVICSDCGLTRIANHTFSGYTDEGDLHSISCTVCGYKLSAEHNYSGEWTADGNACTNTCADCGHIGTKSHNFTYDSETDSAVCSDCGYVVEQPVASVTKYSIKNQGEEETTYVTNLQDAFDIRADKNSYYFLVTLLKDISSDKAFTVYDMDLYLDMNGKKICVNALNGLSIQDASTVKIIDLSQSEEKTGAISALESALFVCNESCLYLGDVTVSGKYGIFLNASTLMLLDGAYLDGTEFGLFTNSVSYEYGVLEMQRRIRFGGSCTVHGGKAAIYADSECNVQKFLSSPAGYYAYYTEDGKLITDLHTDGNDFDSRYQTIVVKECPHESWKYESIDDNTHSKICLGCGITYTEEHNLTEWKLFDSISHIGICSDCGYQSTVLSPHTYDADGFCEGCGAYQKPSQDSNGVYQIANAGNLFWFAALVNGDSTNAYITAADTSAKAVLTQDIDLKNREWTPIGANGTSYKGTFNGQGHTISNMKISNTPADCQGLFGYVYDAAISDFTVTGAINCNNSVSRIGGVVGSSECSRITSVNSYVDITDTGVVLHHVGGIVGSAMNSTTIDKCVNYGNITLTAATDCVGGIAAYVNNNVSIKSSANFGNIHSDAEDAYIGGILGYVNNTAFSGIVNCYNIGEVSCPSNNYCGAVVGWARDGSSYYGMKNNYYLEGCSDNAFGVDGNSGTAESKTVAEFQSGEVAYLLGNDFGQKLGTDDYPLPDAEQVYRYKVTECNGVVSRCTYSNDSTLEVDEVKEHIFSDWNFDREAPERTCTVCGYVQIAAAKVLKGDEVIYVENLEDAFVSDNEGATVVLLKDIESAVPYEISTSLTLDLNGKILSVGYLDTHFSYFIYIKNGAVVTIQDSSAEKSGKISGGTDDVTDDSYFVWNALTIREATAVLNGVTIQNAETGISLSNNANLYVSEGTAISGFSTALALYAFESEVGTISLSDCTLTSVYDDCCICIEAGEMTPRDMLDTSKQEDGIYYAYYTEDGKPVTDNLDSDELLIRSVTVKECNHEGENIWQHTFLENNQHQLTCLACGKRSGDIEACTVSSEWTALGDNHVKTCTVCNQIMESEAHTYTDWVIGTDVHTRTCEVCGYVQQAVVINETNFPDPVFRNMVSGSYIDKDEGGVLYPEEISDVRSIGLWSSDVSNMKGIEYFTSLTYLDLERTPVAEIDLSKNTALTELWLNYTNITSIDLSKNTELRVVRLNDSKLTSVDLSNNTKLRWVNCEDNIYDIGEIGDTFALSDLPGNFDVTKASNWQGAECIDGVLTNFTGIACENKVTYTYDLGNGESETFTLTYTTSEKDKMGEALAGYTISLNGNIGVNFHMMLADDVANSETAYMQFTLPKGNVTQVYVKDADVKVINGNSYYVFSCDVAAKEMTDTITAQMFDTNSEGKVYTYTVKQYADYLFEHSRDNSEYQRAVPLVMAMLNYGSYAQINFNNTANGLANDSEYISEEEKDVSSVTAETLAQFKNEERVKNDFVEFEGSNLSLLSKTTLRLWFTIKDESKLDSITFTCEGNQLESVKSGQYYYVEITDIAAKDLDKDYVVTVSDGTESLDVTFSVMAYCYDVLSREITATRTQELKDTIAALYLYNVEANNYFE